MNKKVLSAILFSALFAGTGTFTSCIDNEAPEGIEELRGATAELIRAKAAVEQAKVQSEAANAAYIQAQAKIAEAQAAHEQAKADKVKAETEMALAQNEIEIALLQQQLAAAEQEMELAAKQMEVEMKNIEASLLQAEAAYLEAESALALLKATMTQAEADKVAALKGALATAKANLATAEDNLFNANQSLYLAMLDKEGDNSEAIFKLNLSLAEKALVAAQAEEAEAKALAEKDVEATEWEKEAEELRAKAKELQGAVLDSLNVEYEKIAANNKKEWDAVLAKKEAIDEALAEEYPVSEYENKTVAENAFVKGLLNRAGAGVDGVFAYGSEDETFVVTGYKRDDNGIVKEVSATGADAYLDIVKNWVEKVGEITISENDKAVAELGMPALEEAVTKKEEAHEAKVALWQIALAAYKDGTATAVPTKLVDDAVAAYNAAFAALEAKVAAHKTAFDAAYEAEYAKLETAYFDGIYKSKMATELVGLGYTGVPTSGLLYTVANLESFYGSKTGLTAAEVKAENDKKAATKKAAEKQVALDIINEVAGTDFAGGAKTAANNVKAVKDALYAINNPDPKKGAVAALAAAYAKLDTEYAKYVTLAEGTYAQTPTEDAAKLTFAGLTGVGAKVKVGTTEYTIAAGEWTKANGNYVAVVRTSISAENKAKIAAVELDETLAENAWRTTSNEAFGENDRVIAPTEAEFREDHENHTLANCGTYGAWLAAQDAVQTLEDQLAASETLTALLAELTAQQAVLEGEIKVAKDAVSNAYTAYTTQVAAYDELFEEVLKAQEETKHLVATYNRIANELETAVGNYYAGLDFEYVNMNGITVTVNAGNAEELAAWFENWYVEAQKKAIEAQGAVQEAQVDLKKYQEGKYDAVALATRNVEKMQAAYDEAKAEYDAALEALNNVLALISAE